MKSVEADSCKMVNIIVWPFLKKAQSHKKGFEQAGINDAQNIELEAEDPFADLL